MNLHESHQQFFLLGLNSCESAISAAPRNLPFSVPELLDAPRASRDNAGPFATGRAVRCSHPFLPGSPHANSHTLVGDFAGCRGQRSPRLVACEPPTKPRSSTKSGAAPVKAIDPSKPAPATDKKPPVDTKQTTPETKSTMSLEKTPLGRPRMGKRSISSQSPTRMAWF